MSVHGFSLRNTATGQHLRVDASCWEMGPQISDSHQPISYQWYLSYTREPRALHCPKGDTSYPKSKHHQVKSPAVAQLPQCTLHLSIPPGRAGRRTKTMPKPVSWQQTGNPAEGKAFRQTIISSPDISREEHLLSTLNGRKRAQPPNTEQMGLLLSSCCSRSATSSLLAARTWPLYACP